MFGGCVSVVSVFIVVDSVEVEVSVAGVIEERVVEVVDVNGNVGVVGVANNTGV